MPRKTVSIILLSLLLASTTVSAFSVRPARADYTWTETIVIFANGSIRPSNAPIHNNGKGTYSLTNNIVGSIPGNKAGIQIQKDNVILDGAGYTLRGTNISGSAGVVTFGSNVTIRNIQVNTCTLGIYVASPSHDNTVNENAITNTTEGVDVRGSSNDVSGNVMIDNENDIVLAYSGASNNIVSRNNISATLSSVFNYAGIWLFCSSDNNVTGNNIVRDLSFESIELDNSTNNVVIGNEATENEGGGIGLQYSSNNSLSLNDIRNNGGSGIIFDESSDNSASGNTIENNSGAGIMFHVSSGIDMINNTIISNHDGIVIDGSFNNLMLNNISSNIGYGVNIGDYGPSNDNSLTINYVTSNGAGGICLGSYCQANILYHNNFVNNTQQVVTDGASTSMNTWDDGSVSGGNYWSDYQQKYPSASQIDNSGIWNTTYTIDANNTDRYPLMFPFSTFIIVETVFTGYFLQHLSLNNTFGIYTSHEGQRPISIHGEIRDLFGHILDVNFPNFSDPSGAYISDPIDMGSLLPFSNTLNVSATYRDGKVLLETLPIEVIPAPSWLVTILKEQAHLTLDPQTEGQWNNPYTIHVGKEFDLSGRFNKTVDLPEWAGGGNYTLLPSIGFEFSFCSNGTCEISTSATAQTTPIEFGPGTVNAYITCIVNGTVSFENKTIVWESAAFSLKVGASASINYPIAGYTFDVDGIGNITIGLSATVKFDANFGLDIVLAPTDNESQELIKGIGVMVQSINSKIEFGAGIAINAGCGLASITGEGDIDVKVHLQAIQPYVYDFAVDGTVSIDYHVLFWSGTIWSMTGPLYHWPNDTSEIPDPMNFTVTARHYNTSDYEEYVWTNGSLSGTAIHNVYPLTRISAVPSGDNAYVLYTDDNVSLSEQSGIYWNGLEFNSSQGALKPLLLPTITDEIVFNPVAISLPNGSILVMWNSIPLDEVSNAAGPLNVTKVIPQYSCFNTNIQSWGPTENLAESGVTTSYLPSSDSAGSYALVLRGDSIFSSNQSLVEYDLQNGSELLGINVVNASNIASFNCFSHLAILQMLNGSYEVLNLTSSQLINLPSIAGCQVKIVQLATNSTDSVGVLYSSNATSDIFSIYDLSSSTTSFSMNISQSTSSLTLAQVGSGYQLITGDSSGITSYMIEGQGTHQTAFYPMENITSLGSTDTEKGILVYTTENYGNSSYPLLNLTLTFIPKPPVANFTYSPILIMANSTTTFDAGSSAATIGNIASYSWDFGDSNTTTTTSPIATHVYISQGVYNVTLTVTDSQGLTDSTQQTVTVTPPSPLVHDVAVTNATVAVPHCSSKPGNDSWVFQGLPVYVNVTVFNKGDFDENVTITLYYNITANEIIGKQNVTLSPCQNETIAFMWDTTGVPCCQNYTLTAVATISLDINPADNTLSTEPITVRILGDINGDGKADIKDISMVTKSFGSCGPNYLHPGSPPSSAWNFDADINGDNRVDVRDLALVARNFGK